MQQTFDEFCQFWDLRAFFVSSQIAVLILNFLLFYAYQHVQHLHSTKHHVHSIRIDFQSNKIVLHLINTQRNTHSIWISLNYI